MNTKEILIYSIIILLIINLIISIFSLFSLQKKNQENFNDNIDKSKPCADLGGQFTYNPSYLGGSANTVVFPNSEEKIEDKCYCRAGFHIEQLSADIGGQYVCADSDGAFGGVRIYAWNTFWSWRRPE
jgi:amino acid transporter